MEKMVIKRRNIFGINLIILLLSFTVSGLLFTSCERGHDGQPGNAYLALSYEGTEPTYIDAGTPAIPAVFQWNYFYPAYPGTFTLYYEGDYFNGSQLSHYTWQVNYVIWINPGQKGGYGFDGHNGADSYLTLDCTSQGAVLDRLNKMDIINPDNQMNNIRPDTSFPVVADNGYYSIKVTSKRINSLKDGQD